MPVGLVKMNRRNFITLAATTIAGAFIAAKQAPAAALVVPNSDKLPEDYKGYAFIFDPHPLRFRINDEGDNFEQIREFNFNDHVSPAQWSAHKNPDWKAAPFELRIASKVDPKVEGEQFIPVMIRRVLPWEEFTFDPWEVPQPLTIEALHEIAALFRN